MTVELGDEPIVVTGAAGWLGRALVAELAHAHGDQLRCLVRDVDEELAVKGIAPEAEIVVGDMRDPAAVDQLVSPASGATVFHAASVIHPQQFIRELFDVNVGGTELLLDRTRRVGIRRLVYVSSNSPFGTNPDPHHVFDEASPFHPYLAYGRSKMEAEVLVQRANTRGDTETVTIRCPWFYGPHQPPRQTQFFRLVARGVFPMFGRGKNRRSLAYTGNLVQGLLLAAASPQAAGRAYWIADARPYEMREVLAAVKAALVAEGVEVARRQVRFPGAVGLAAELGDRLIQVTGRYSAQLHVLGELRHTIACSIELARDELGYEPEVDLQEGMRRSVRWCIERGEFG